MKRDRIEAIRTVQKMTEVSLSECKRSLIEFDGNVLDAIKHLMSFERRTELRNWLITRDIVPNSLSGPPTPEEKELARYLEFREGDYISLKVEQSCYVVYKLLKIWWTSDTYHCAIFEPLSSQPRKADLPDLQLKALHAPFDREQIDKYGVYIGHFPVTQEEMIGYATYLSLTGSNEADYR